MCDLHNGTTRYIMKLASVIRTVPDSFVDGTTITPMEARALLLIGTASGPIYIEHMTRNAPLGTL